MIIGIERYAITFSRGYTHKNAKSGAMPRVLDVVLKESSEGKERNKCKIIIVSKIGNDQIRRINQRT